MSGENYQTSSEQHMLIAVREIRQALQVQPQPTNHKTHSNQKHEKFNRTLSRQSFLFCPLFVRVQPSFNFFLSLNEPIFNRMILLFLFEREIMSFNKNFGSRNERILRRLKKTSCENQQNGAGFEAL